MTHSFRHTPIVGNTKADSEAADKRIWHQRFRTRAKQELATCVDFEAYVGVDLREVSDPWTMAKDGRQWLDCKKRPHLRKYLHK
jgi:hypothetical protein